MPTDVEKLRDRMKNYLGKIPGTEIMHANPAAMMIAPVETGLHTFIKVDGLPDLQNLPFIPERMRDFAFRYATEYKPRRFWAKEYGVSYITIDKWLRHEGVRAYIALTRFERRMFNFAQSVIVERNAYKAMNAVLTTKITADTIGTVFSAAKFIYELLNNPAAVSDRAKGTLNVNIGFGGNGQTPTNPYQQERNVTPKQFQEMREEIENLEYLAKKVGVDLGGNN